MKSHRHTVVDAFERCACAPCINIAARELPPMKPLGIVGGIGDESTVDYYRSLIKMLA